MQRTVKSYGPNNYIEYKPAGEAKGTILFLHGVGERGSNVADVERNELPKILLTQDVPYIVVAPQLPANQGGWWDNILKQVITVLKTYPGPYHVTGLSLGGIGTFNALRNAPGLFSTAGVVCGKDDAQAYTEYTRIPIKCWYGTVDTVIPWGYSNIKDLVQNKLAGYDAQLHEYQGEGHGIWSMAYNFTPTGYWHWLAQKEPNQPPDAVINTYVKAGQLIFETQSGKRIALPVPL